MADSLQPTPHTAALCRVIARGCCALQAHAKKLELTSFKGIKVCRSSRLSGSAIGRYNGPSSFRRAFSTGCVLQCLNLRQREIDRLAPKVNSSDNFPPKFQIMPKNILETK